MGRPICAGAPSRLWLAHPTDTLEPTVFDWKDSAWDPRGKSHRVAQFCGGGHKGHDDDDDD
jgi:hypothetical protein